MSKPLYCVIAANGKRFSVVYHSNPECGQYNQTLDGYGPDVFKDVPATCPVVDFRSVPNDDKILDLIYSFDSIKERDLIHGNPWQGKVITVADYLQKCEEIGASVYPLHALPQSPTPRGWASV